MPNNFVFLNQIVVHEGDETTYHTVGAVGDNYLYVNGLEGGFCRKGWQTFEDFNEKNYFMVDAIQELWIQFCKGV